MHNNVPEGPPYPIRSVFDGEYHYIRNLEPNEIYIEKHLMGSNGDGKLNNPYWATWVFASSDDEATYELVKRYTRRPAETLYHTAEDPFEMKNLINQDNLSDIQGRLASELDVWMKTQGDPGSAQDSLQALNASRRGEHRYIPPSK